jgi:uncharacterized protein YkwD
MPSSEEAGSSSPVVQEMDSTIANRTRRRALSALFAASAALIGVLAPGAAQAGAACANANLQPASADDVPAAEAATRCLVNQQRRKRGLRSLKYNRDLQKSSDWQANDMLQYEYFDHQRSGGPSFAGRITRFGYGGSSGYSLGENIAWSTADAASPKEIVSMWMHSPGHKANILRRQFKEQAISAVYAPGPVGGDFDDNGPLVVYVNQFGTRY